MRQQKATFPRDAPYPAVLDLLATKPCSRSFPERVRSLRLSRDLENKILDTNALSSQQKSGANCTPSGLNAEDEREIAGEMLRQRHLFTEQLLTTAQFRQAALTVIQNLYLFKNRRIFLSSPHNCIDHDRQDGLALFSLSPPPQSLPLAKTLQHALIARIWYRIVTTQSSREEARPEFLNLLEIVDQLNTLRNIYILCTQGLVHALVARARCASLAITFEDATQIGAFGVARAAYRYHPGYRVRFSTFAAPWIFREIQQQALHGRLIRISSNSIEAYARAKKSGDGQRQNKLREKLDAAASLPPWSREEDYQPSSMAMPSPPTPEWLCEQKQLRHLLLDCIDKVLDRKKGDILKRRFGLPPYLGREESILAISNELGVTRSSIYQLEESALRAMHHHLNERM